MHLIPAGEVGGRKNDAVFGIKRTAAGNTDGIALSDLSDRMDDVLYRFGIGRGLKFDFLRDAVLIPENDGTFCASDINADLHIVFLKNYKCCVQFSDKSLLVGAFIISYPRFIFNAKI